MCIRDSTYTVDAEDDAFHSNGNLAVSGGTYTLSSGDDGIHADSNVTISGGKIDIMKSYEGLELSLIHIWLFLSHCNEWDGGV